MTYIPAVSSNETAIKDLDLTVLYNSTNTISISAGSVMPWGSEYQLEGSVSYSVSSGVVTLPSGYSYLVKFAVACQGPTVTSDTISYQIYDTGASAYVGRRGHLCWQESTFLTGGDEYAIALLDCSSSAKTIDARILAVSSAGFTVDPNVSYSGRSRLEIFRFK